MLTVYRASAGSGKTHKLTGEYLKLVFSSQGAFRHILAVTFTNKATEEMKSRIVDELYNLSSGKESDYLQLLADTYSLSPQAVRRKASDILKEILHDYSSFNISTIDKFFQQTMRAFTREIGLQGGFGIEMDQNLVLETVIDNLLSDLSKPENKDLLGWLIKFAEDKVERGTTWNLRQDIFSLAKELFKETYKAYSTDITNDIKDKSSLEEYKTELHKIISSTESRVKALGEKGKKILSDFWLDASDIKGGSRSPLFTFDRLAAGEMKTPSDTFMKLADNLDNFFTKTTPNDKRALIEEAFNGGLNNCIKEIAEVFADLAIYNSAKEVVRYYYTLGILTDISAQIAQYRADKNVMLIADTTELLNKVIDDSNTPFIYEKIGTRVDHYMIDEFQDTSGMQWQNFRPLIEESLAQQQENLIVGDVKQSIYRFRNSDWKLLDEKIGREFGSDELAEETLKDNWRSCRNIVEFNNALFTIMPLLLQSLYNEDLMESVLSQEQKDNHFSKIVSAYNHSFQRVPPPFAKKDGHVKIEFIEDTEEKSWKDESLDRLPGILEKLQDKGYSLKDIAILVRTNMEGSEVADKLITHGEENAGNGYKYDIISDEALYISNAGSIKFIIALLRYLQNPFNNQFKELALYSYQVLRDEFGKENPLFSEEIQKGLQQLSRQSIYETVEGLCRLFAEEIKANEQVFIQAFLDMVSEYTQKESADLNSFLKWWDESGKMKTIATPDGQNAVRILTVHKSKGLGFKAVIIPFATWEIDHKPTKPVILWCRPSTAPFNRMHLLPVRYGKTLIDTIFAEDYFKEKLYAFIDNMNTLYVALTRAKEEMIILSPAPAKLNKAGVPEKINTISDALWSSLMTELPDASTGEQLLQLPPSFDTEEKVFELGSWWQTSEKKNDKKSIKEIAMSTLPSVSPDERLQLRLHGKGFFFDNEQRKHGTLMHEILSRINTPDNIDISVDHYFRSGIINKDEVESLKKRLTQILAREEVKHWYEEGLTVLNEIDILGGKSLMKRPDRVIIKDGQVTIIDYKFGTHQNKSYRKQLQEYIRLIRKMGYKEVTGHIWYVELDKIETITE